MRITAAVTSAYLGRIVDACKTPGVSTQPISWSEMQDALSRARRSSVAVMTAVSEATDRPSAALALAEIVGCRAGVADQLLDVDLAQFISTAERSA